MNIKHPKIILEELQEYERLESNTTHSSVRTQLSYLKLISKEKLIDFVERYDTIIRDYENCIDAISLSSVKKRSTFYQVVSEKVPEFRQANLSRMSDGREKMNIRDMNIYLLQLEAE